MRKVVKVCSNDRVQEQFLQKKTTVKEIYFRFPDVDNECIAHGMQIIHQLAPPRDLRRGRFVFSGLTNIDDVE
jgi:hypothetical protein